MTYKILESKLDYILRGDLNKFISKSITEGWTIIYVIPGPTYTHNYYNQPSINYNTTTINFDMITGSTYYPTTNTTPSESPFEVWMIKYELEPCPTCSHLNPDRLDREV